MQRYITAFVATRDPNAFRKKKTGLITFSKYGSEASMVNFNLTFVDVVVDPIKDSRYAAFSFTVHVFSLWLFPFDCESSADVIDQDVIGGRRHVFLRSWIEQQYTEVTAKLLLSMLEILSPVERIRGAH
jgi:hypothetical protein